MQSPVNHAQYCTFTVADLQFGIEAPRVQEVFLARPTTPVPRAPQTVVGLMNLRGQIVAVLDFRRRLELPPREADVQPMSVVLRTSDGAVCLLVDSIGDIVHPAEDSFVSVPESLDPATRSAISGAFKMPGHLMLALDVDRAVDVSGARFEAPAAKSAKPNLQSD